jgi:hypothetical protein
LQPDKQVRSEFSKKFGTKTELLENKEKMENEVAACFMERAMGIEPTSEAWEASILPLYDARSFL